MIVNYLWSLVENWWWMVRGVKEVLQKIQYFENDSTGTLRNKRLVMDWFRFLLSRRFQQGEGFLAASGSLLLTPLWMMCTWPLCGAAPLLLDGEDGHDLHLPRLPLLLRLLPGQERVVQDPVVHCARVFGPINRCLPMSTIFRESTYLHLLIFERAKAKNLLWPNTIRILLALCG